MKKLLLILGMLLFLFISFGQSPNDFESQSPSYNSHYSGDASISLITPNIFFDNRDGSYIGGGLKLRIFVSKRFSFDSGLIMGRGFTQFGVGIVGLPLWYIASHPGLNFDEGELTLPGVLMMGTIMILSAEHFAYHLPVNNRMDISPYISLLRFRQKTNEQNSVNPKEIECPPGCAFGIEINQYFRKFIISPYFDVEKTYGSNKHGSNFGISVGYYFSNK